MVEAHGQRHHASTPKPDGADQSQSQSMQPRCCQPGGEHDAFAQREIDQARRLVDHHKSEGNQGVERAGEYPIDE